MEIFIRENKRKGLEGTGPIFHSHRLITIRVGVEKSDTDDESKKKRKKRKEKQRSDLLVQEVKFLSGVSNQVKLLPSI